MRSVALTVVALAASGALAQAEDAKPTFTVRSMKYHELYPRTHSSFLIAHRNQGTFYRTVHRRLV